MGCQCALSFLLSDSGYRRTIGYWTKRQSRVKRRMSVREVNAEVVLSSCTMVVTRLADKS